MVIKQAIVDEIKERMIAARHVLVLTHINPDGDALGSLTAVGGILQQLQVEYTLAVDKGMDARLGYLPLSDRVRDGIDPREDYDLLIAVDASDPGRLGDSFATIRDIPPIINIDHHGTNPNFGTVDLVLPTIPSACEILYELFVQMGMTIDLDIATSLMTGIVTDTLGFRTPNVKPRTLEIASALMQAGANLAFITMQTLNLQSYLSLDLWRTMLGNMQFKGGFISSAASYDERVALSVGKTGSGGLSSLLGNVEEAKMAATLSEVEPGIVRVSLRCRPPYDVSEVAAVFGGGGHQQASGCTIYDTAEGAQQALSAAAVAAIARQTASLTEA